MPRVRSLLSLVLALLAVGLLPPNVRAQDEGAGRPVAPPQDPVVAADPLVAWIGTSLEARVLPRTAAETAEQLQLVGKAIETLSKSLEALKDQETRPRATLLQPLVDQQSELSSLKTAFDQNAGLVPERIDEEKAKLLEQIAALEEERRQLEAQVAQPIAVPEGDVTDQTFAEANAEKTRIENARSAATQALELARAARSGRVEVLNAMTQELARTRERLLGRKTELQSKRDVGESGEVVEELVELVWKNQLKAHRLELLRTFQQAEIDREVLALRQQRAELEKNNLDRQLARQERRVKLLAERKKEQDERRKEQDKRDAARSAALPPGQALLASMLADARESLEEKQAIQDWWSTHAGNGESSELATALAEATVIRERLDEDPDAPGALDPGPAQIRNDLEASQRHLELTVRLGDKLGEDMRRARREHDEASLFLDELDEIVADARAADAEAGAEVADARYEDLESELREALQRQRAAMTDLVKSLALSTEENLSHSDKLRDLRHRAAENRFDLQRRKRWTQEEQVVSAAAVEMAFTDARDALLGLARSPERALTAVIAYFADATNTARFVVAGVLVLIALLIFRLIRKHLPKTTDWLEETDTPAMRRAMKALGLIVRRTSLSFLLALVFVGVPWITGFPDRWVAILAIFLLTPFVYRFGRVILDVLFEPDFPEGGFFALEEQLAHFLHRIGRYLLNLALVFVPFGYLLGVLGYDERNPGFVRLWWMIYKLMTNALILITIFRPMVLRRVIRGTSVVATSLKSWIIVGYPIFVLAMLLLFALNSLRYLEAERFYRLLFLQTAAVALAAFVAYRLLLNAVLKNKDVSRQIVADDFPDQESYLAAGRALFIDRSIRLVLRILFILPAFFILQALWVDVDLRFLDAPLWGEGEGLSLRDVFAAGLGIVVVVAIVRAVKGFLNFIVAPSMDLDVGLRYTISTLAAYAVMTLGGIVILNMLNVKGEQIAIVTGALAFGIGFGLQSIVKNFISGLILLIERPVKVGDRVDVGTAGGLVDKITLRATTVMTWDGVGIVIPNEQLIGGTLTNHSLGFPRLRSRLSIGVAYGSDLGRVRDLIAEIVKKHGLVLKRPEPEVLFQSFGEFSLVFDVTFWTQLSANRPRIQSDLRYALDAAFRKNGIEVPLPQRDVNLRVRPGGEPLALSGWRRGGRRGDEAKAAETRAGEAPEEGADDRS